jgi:hypothetical protein
MPDPEVKVEEPKVEAPKKVEIDYETAARAEGWRSKEELGPDFDAGKYVSAEEFMKRKPLFDNQKELKKEIRELKKQIEAVVNFSEKNAQIASKRAIAEFKAQRKEAIKAGDEVAVETLDTAIKDQEKILEGADKAKKEGVAPEIVEWTKTNQWFNKDMELQDFAVAYCASYTKAHPDEGMDKALEQTAKATKRAFPDSPYFKEAKVKREEAPVVESPKAEGGGNGKKYTVDRLSAEQKLAYKAYVKEAKIMTHDQYFQKLEEINALEGA